MNFHRVLAKYFLQRLAQQFCFWHIEHQFSAVIQAYDAIVIVNDNHWILHVLKYGLIR